MRLRFPGDKVRPFAWALLALGAAVVLLPAPASASCGHYVLWKHQTALSGVKSHAGLDLLAEAGALAVSRPEPPAGPVDPPGRPCTGAFCSGSPATPVLPEPPVPPPAEQWGLVLPGATAPSPSPFHRLADECPARPSHLGAGVFHPPRAPRFPLPY